MTIFRDISVLLRCAYCSGLVESRIFRNGSGRCPHCQAVLTGPAGSATLRQLARRAHDNGFVIDLAFVQREPR